jgi:hypothetical protein
LRDPQQATAEAKLRAAQSSVPVTSMRNPAGLSDRHVEILRTIGHSGGSARRLGDLAGTRELRELEQGGWVWRDFIEQVEDEWGRTSSAIWYLTDRGAKAVGIDPTRIYRPESSDEQ